MKVIQVALPDELAAELEALVREGWAGSPDEIIRRAMADFLRRHSPILVEQFQREDIAWALQQKRAERD